MPPRMPCSIPARTNHIKYIMRPRERGNRRRNAPPSPNMVDTERYERLLEVLEELDEASLHAPLIVEGKRDREALRSLGVKGDIISLNRGQGMHEFAESVAGSHERVVLLMDWDSTGEKLQERLTREFKGMWEEHESFRRLLRVLCQKEVRDIEGLPALIRRLSANAIARPEG